MLTDGEVDLSPSDRVKDILGEEHASLEGHAEVQTIFSELTEYSLTDNDEQVNFVHTVIKSRSMCDYVVR